MKYLLIPFILAFFATACSPYKQVGDILCTHPGIMGGYPFPLPENVHRSRTGDIRFMAPDGVSRVTLTGAACLQVERK